MAEAAQGEQMELLLPAQAVIPMALVGSRSRYLLTPASPLSSVHVSLEL